MRRSAKIYLGISSAFFSTINGMESAEQQAKRFIQEILVLHNTLTAFKHQSHKNLHEETDTWINLLKKKACYGKNLKN